MILTAISDLHGNLPEVGSGDLLLICGDIIPLSIQSDIGTSRDWFATYFYNWTNKLNYDKVIFIAGNHDAYLCRCKKEVQQLFSKASKVTYLCNESYIYIDNSGKLYTIFGTPYCHQFGNWSFMVSDETLKKKFSEIPENVDILISHDPPTLGNVGIIQQINAWNFGRQCGNSILTEALLEKKPKNAFFGHIHSGCHEFNNIEGINMANVSILNENYYRVYDPLTINI